jgi:hypothetical protein
LEITTKSLNEKTNDYGTLHERYLNAQATINDRNLTIGGKDLTIKEKDGLIEELHKNIKE